MDCGVGAMNKVFSLIFTAVLLWGFRHITMDPGMMFLGLCILIAGFAAGGSK